MQAPVHGWLRASLIYGGAVLIGINLVAVPSASFYLKNLHGLTDQQYGAVFLPQLVMSIVGALAAGPAVRRFSLKSMYSAALSLMCLSLAALALSAAASDYVLPLLMLSIGCFGLGFGFGGGPLNGLVCQAFPNRMDSALTALHMLAGVGLMLGPLYFGLFETVGAWHIGPIGASVLAAALVVAVFLLLPTDTPTLTADSSRTSPAATQYFWVMIAIALLYGFVEATFSNWAVIFASEARGLDARRAATALSCFWAGLTGGRFLVMLLVGRFGVTRIWYLMPLLMCVALSSVPYSDGFSEVIAAFLFGGLACSAFFPLLISVASRPFPEAVAWIASMLTAALMAGVGMVSYLIGSLMEALTIERVYFFTSIIPVLMLALMLISQKTIAQSTKK